ncbi:MAG: hypothetical protein ACYC4L_11655 [Chloroflexota bacterium]
MRRFVGLALLIIAFVGVGLYSYFAQRPLNLGRLPDLPTLPWQNPYEPVVLSGYVGGEKVGFLRDPQVRSLLSSRYNITLNVTGTGSLDMVAGNTEGIDFLWPSSQLALDLYKQQNRPLVRDEVIFNSPLVLYSWAPGAAALEREGAASRGDDGRYSVDLSRLVGYLAGDATWQDIGLSQLFGQVRVATTDPTRSASGSQFAGLLAVTLNGGIMVDENSVGRHLPAITRVFTAGGFQHRQSGDLFAQYIQQGMGAYPLAVGYESQLIEYAVQNERQLATIVERTRILYPRPTVWSSHPLLVLDQRAERLIQALQDPEVQQLAWTRHGWRSGLAGTGTAPEGSALRALAIPAEIETAVPLPGVQVMRAVGDALGR